MLRLNHGKVNAFDLELMRRWIDEITLLERAETSAVVLTGTGSVFSAGVDLRQLIAGGREYVQEFVPLLGDMLFKTFTFLLQPGRIVPFVRDTAASINLENPTRDII